jgi:CheY-like chemotaxis protein
MVLSHTDLILMDINLGGTNGINLTAKRTRLPTDRDHHALYAR